VPPPRTDEVLPPTRTNEVPPPIIITEDWYDESNNYGQPFISEERNLSQSSPKTLYSNDEDNLDAALALSLDENPRKKEGKTNEELLDVLKSIKTLMEPEFETLRFNTSNYTVEFRVRTMNNQYGWVTIDAVNPRDFGAVRREIETLGRLEILSAKQKGLLNLARLVLNDREQAIGSPPVIPTTASNRTRTRTRTKTRTTTTTTTMRISPNNLSNNQKKKRKQNTSDEDIVEKYKNREYPYGTLGNWRTNRKENFVPLYKYLFPETKQEDEAIILKKNNFYSFARTLINSLRDNDKVYEPGELKLEDLDSNSGTTAPTAPTTDVPTTNVPTIIPDDSSDAEMEDT